MRLIPGDEPYLWARHPPAPTPVDNMASLGDQAPEQSCDCVPAHSPTRPQRESATAAS